MRTEMYWIEAPAPGRLAIMPRPRGGDWLEDEVRAWALAGVDIVVSLLTPSEIAEFDLTQEKSLCGQHGIGFIEFPIADRTVPALEEAFAKLVSELAESLAEGRSIAIHCRQGIGRAAMLAICVLIASGVDLESARANASAARGCPVPETAEQERWIAKFGREWTAAATR